MPRTSLAPLPDLSLEDALGGRVAGVDEVGRGPLAGPVVACAAVLTPGVALPEGLTDSKRLTARQRDRICTALLATTLHGLGWASVEEIDRLNILEAAMLAMRRAVAALPFAPDIALVDGARDPGLPCPARTVIGGDGRSLSIAAASVIAKVTRDRYMAELAEDFPGYGWESNAGYGSAAHLDALARLGPTPHHRRSFRPVAQILERQSNGTQHVVK